MEEEKEGDAICMRVTSIASRSLCSSRSFKCQCQVATDGRMAGLRRTYFLALPLSRIRSAILFARAPS